MPYLNRATIMGHLGRDPEVRDARNGTPVATLSVATTRRWQRDGQWQEDTQWHRVIAWDWRARYAEERLQKGSLVYVEGRLQTREWEDRDGQTHRVTEIVADVLHGLDRLRPRGGGEEPPPF